MAKILIACEESQAVCKAFRKLGHEAYSCDILECSGGHPEWHIKGDVLEQLDKQWDLIIAHPPCTYLTNSGVRWLYNKDKSKNITRWNDLKNASEFFKKLLECDCKYIAVENPIMHKHAVNIIGRRQDQLIQPWMFGHGETKATCLWLKNLPKLEPTDIVKGREQRIWNMVNEKGKKVGWNTDEIKKLRSKTYPGIAKAMAEQWSKLILSNN